MPLLYSCCCRASQQVVKGRTSYHTEAVCPTPGLTLHRHGRQHNTTRASHPLLRSAGKLSCLSLAVQPNLGGTSSETTLLPRLKTLLLYRFSASDIRVRLGEYTFDSPTDGAHVDFDVDDIRMHESYNSDTQLNDIAVVKLDRPTTFNDIILPVCLPPPGVFYEGRSGYVTGWGTIYFGGPISSTLQEVVVPVWSREDCSNAYPGKVFSGMMCAGIKTGGKDSCQGDSGGPYQIQDPGTRRWYLVGVVSWGIQCAKPENPGVYTEVSLYIDWIKANAVF